MQFFCNICNLMLYAGKMNKAQMLRKNFVAVFLQLFEKLQKNCNAVFAL